MSKPRLKPNFWYLQFEGTEFGPFSLSEVKEMLKSRKIRGALYVWQDGMMNWVLPQAIPELQPFVKLPESTQPRIHRDPLPSRSRAAFGNRDTWIRVGNELQEQRQNERRTLIATVSMISPPRTRLMLGVCEDVSLNGMQIILDADHEIATDTEFTLEIHPIGISGVPSFRVTANALWAKPEERRVGFKFDRLNPADRRGLQLYLEASQLKLDIEKKSGRR